MLEPPPLIISIIISKILDQCWFNYKMLFNIQSYDFEVIISPNEISEINENCMIMYVNIVENPNDISYKLKLTQKQINTSQNDLIISFDETRINYFENYQDVFEFTNDIIPFDNIKNKIENLIENKFKTKFLQKLIILEIIRMCLNLQMILFHSIILKIK